MSAYTDMINADPTLKAQRDNALALFDAGIPNEIKDPFYRRVLNTHRWGWHSTHPIGDICPACERNNNS